MSDDEDEAARDELRRDVKVIREYGAQHPDSWTGLRREGDRIVAVFTDPAAHREAVLSIVARPDQVDVLAGRFTERHLESVVAEVREVLAVNPGSWNRLGARVDEVHVGLRGGYDELAQQLHERFGDAVRLSVGLHRFPLDPRELHTPRPAPESTVELDGAVLETVPDSTIVVTRGRVTGLVQVDNRSTVDRLALQTDQPVHGVLLDASGWVVSGSSGFNAGTGRSIDLGPGESTTVRFSAGTDAVDPGVGTTLPRGRYQLVVVLPVHGSGTRGQIVAPAVPIEIVDAR